MISLRQYSPGEIIFKENDEGNSAYILEEGCVEVTRHLEGQEVHLAHLGPGEIFGEMSLIDERPRCATVKAVEKTTVREVPREEFSRGLQSDPQAMLSLLKVLFERLREANSTILQLQKNAPLACTLPTQTLSQIKKRPMLSVLLEGMTPKADQVLPVSPFEIKKFPFRIGRKTHDPLATNDLMIPDSEPFKISLHHISFIQGEEGIGIVDRGSRLGSLLNGDQLGGVTGEPQPVFLSAPESILVLGDIHSPFKFKVRFQSQ